MEELKLKRCLKCGALVKVLQDCNCDDGIMCCGEKMQDVVANSMDASFENHVPTYQKEDEHFGWLNGDIDFATDGNYFTILFEDEEHSSVYGSQINIGVIDCPLKNISDLSGSYDVLIELAK